MSYANEYLRSFVFAESSGSGGDSATAYEDVNGEIHSISSGSDAVIPVHVTKSYYQETPVLTVHPGDTFEIPKNFGQTVWGNDYEWTTMVARCTSAEISDEVIEMKAPDVIKRLWLVTLEGTVVPEVSGETGGGSVLRMEVDYNEEHNGSTDRTVGGRLVLLTDSTTPRRSLRITAYGATVLPPVHPRDTYAYAGYNFVVLRAGSKKRVVEQDGVITTILYDYTVEAEL